MKNAALTTMHSMRSCIGLVAATLFCAPALGATVYTDRAAFIDAVVNPINYDFEIASGFPAAPTGLASFAGGTVLLTTDGGDPVAHLYQYDHGFGQAIGGQLSGAPRFGFPLRMTFLTPRFAVGFDDLDLTGGGTEFGVINIAYSNGALTEQFSVEDPDGVFTTAAFFGVIAANPIASIQVYGANVVGPPPGGRTNLIDNVILAEIPEPATLMLLTLAAAGACLRQHRSALRADLGEGVGGLPTEP